MNLPRGQAFQFKAVKLFRFGNVVWERFGRDNRHHTVATTRTELVDFTWDDGGP